MAIDFKKVADEIKFRGTTEAVILELLSRVYGSGYRSGWSDHKKVDMKTRYKYLLLINWINSQLSQFSSYTKRFEYKDILDGIEASVSQYLFENGLRSSHKPSEPFTVTVDGVEETLDPKADLAYLLSDIVGDFITKEEKKNVK